MGDEARECMMNSERRANTMQNAMEEAKTLLEQADRARKMTEQEFIDTNETLADLTVQNQSLATSKRKLEQDITDLRNDCDEATNEANMTEDKAKKAMLDAAKLAEELRYEQDAAVQMDRERKEFEAKVHELQCQLDDAEQHAIKWGKKMASKLESRVKD